MNHISHVLWLDVAEFEKIAERSGIEVKEAIRGAVTSTLKASLPSLLRSMAQSSWSIGIALSGKKNEAGLEAVVMTITGTDWVLKALQERWEGIEKRDKMIQERAAE